jgi:periplasmic divalent cation tolerance protein
MLRSMETASGEGFRLVLTTVPNEATAVRLAHALVDERLAACVNIVPGLRSIYRWKAAIEDDQELLCLIKTSADLLPRVAARMKELHPYEVPELLALTPEQGSKTYLAWIADSIS